MDVWIAKPICGQDMPGVLDTPAFPNSTTVNTAFELGMIFICPLLSAAPYCPAYRHPASAVAVVVCLACPTRQCA